MTITGHLITEDNGNEKSWHCGALASLSRERLEEIETKGLARPSLHDCGNHFVEAPNDASSL